MTCTLHMTWDDRLAGYDFGPSHPMAPVRLKLTIELARAFGFFRLDGVSVEVPAAATRAELELYHFPPTSTSCGWLAAVGCWARASRT